MYYVFAKGYDYHACDYTETYFGSRKTAAEAKELCKDIHRNRGKEFPEIWYERTSEPEEQYLSYRDDSERRYYL